jgi:Fe-S-cluster-containing hydrogenase component 2
MDAVLVEDGTAVVNLERCIGCGNCVVICPAEAITLKKKEEQLVPPKNMGKLYQSILAKKIGRLNMLKVGAKMALGRKV